MKLWRDSDFRSLAKRDREKEKVELRRGDSERERVFFEGDD